MRLVEAAKPVFARHETFHPRYGWFRKAYAFVGDDARIFMRKDAPVRMGVGKNMVRAIRFWGTAAKLIAESPDARPGRSASMVRTGLGDRLFGDDGWDPYMEEPATLWLLHWLLLASPCWLPVWWVAFNEFHAVEFDVGDLESVILTQLQVAAEWKTPHRSSIRKDVRALLRTYTPADGSARMGIDDILNCPFRELGLIGRSKPTDRYRFTTGAKPTLPAAVVGFAAIDYVARMHPGSRTVTLSHLAQASGGPGRVFKLLEGDLREALVSVAAKSATINLVTVAGATQLSWSGDPAETAVAILDDYYSRSSRRPPTTTEVNA